MNVWRFLVFGGVEGERSEFGLFFFIALHFPCFLSLFDPCLLSRGAGLRSRCCCLRTKGLLLPLEQLRSSSWPRALFSSFENLCRWNHCRLKKKESRSSNLSHSLARW